MRPNELADAYFAFDGEVFDITPHRNHRDWLLENVELPEYTKKLTSKALYESYKLGYIRLVWDEFGNWNNGKIYSENSTLYINGIDKTVWKNIRKILCHNRWHGIVNNVIIEYLDIVNNGPSWKRSDIFKGGDLESLYRGKKPRRSIVPSGVYF